MKALIIIAACLALAIILRIVEVTLESRPIKSVGAKANDKSRSMAKIDINNPMSIAEAIEHYKDLDD